MYKKIFKLIHVFFVSVGLNFLKLKNIFYFPKYIKELLIFIFKGGHVSFPSPVLGEHSSHSGSFDKQYFYQDLIIANYIYKNKPTRHIDIGSRVDGFVSNVASFRKIEVFDIRKNHFNHKNIIFKKFDFMKSSISMKEITDSLSCLHTVEHFGLGRYGDTINPDGHIIGFKNILTLLKKKGLFYFSVPISKLDRVYFNSERTFEPSRVLKWSKDLQLVRFDLIYENGKIFYNCNVNNRKIFSELTYGCGLYTFRKI
jgi:hypothetical protein